MLQFVGADGERVALGFATPTFAFHFGWDLGRLIVGVDVELAGFAMPHADLVDLFACGII